MKIHETEHAITRSIVNIRQKPLAHPPLQFTFVTLSLTVRHYWFRFTGRKYDNEIRVTGRRCYCLLGSPAY